jgi:DNA-binding protein HU-beta
MSIRFFFLPGALFSTIKTRSSIHDKESRMFKAEIVKTLKEQAGLSTLAQAEASWDGLFDIILGALKKGDAVAIPGFGSFKVTQRKARTGRNPRTGQEIQIPAGRTVRFTPGKALKESL